MATFRRRRTAKGESRYMARVHGLGAKTFTTMADAKLWAGEMERRKRLGELYTAPVASFGAYLDDYVNRYSPGWRASTTENVWQLRTYLVPLEPLPLEAIDRARVDTLVTEVAAHAPNRAGKTLALVKRVLRDAQERRYRVDVAVYSLKPPKYEKRPLRWLTMEQVNQLASWMPDFVQRIVVVAALTGMRQGELFALRDEDLHLDDGYLEVRRGKTVNATRKVWLGDAVVRVLREQLLRRPHAEYVFPAYEGGPLNKNNMMQRYFRPARARAGLDKDVTFHSLRHTFVSLAAAQGVKEGSIAEMAGWSANGWRAMFGLYRHFFAEEAPAEAAKMDSLLQEESA